MNEFRISTVIKRDEEAENPGFKGFPAFNTSALAKVFDAKVVASAAKGTIVNVVAEDLQ